MIDFNEIRKAVDEQLQMMAENNRQLYTVDVSKDEMWDTYIKSFPEGTNEMFRERTEHDCNCCKNYIRNVGNVVAIIDDELVSIWDITIDNPFQEVADAMKALVLSKSIRNIFITQFNKVGMAKNVDTENHDITWNHFQSDIPSRFVKDPSVIGTELGKAQSQHDVYSRALIEIDLESLEIVHDLIAQGSIYRGEEHKGLVDEFIKRKKAYILAMNKELFSWSDIGNVSGAVVSFKNSVIGTLVFDIAKGVPLEDAVKMFESKVAPSNYKRPKALATPAMIKKAMKEWTEMGYFGAEKRRHAKPGDLTINNILFADRSTKPELSGFDELLAESEVSNPKSFDKLETVGVETFLKDILPTAESLEIMVENTHQNSFMSLIAPVDGGSKNMLKWKNNFSWSYNGEVADSMKERVKTAGGKVDGVLRFSIQWNEDGNDGSNDIDAHCKLPGGHISYSKKSHSSSGGSLDVDITRPATQTPKGVAVENITWADIKKMPDGDYKFYVHNYSGRNTDGFRAQVEMDGEVQEFSWDKSVTNDVTVATVTLKNGKFTIKNGTSKSLRNSATPQEIWGVNTNTFTKVNMVMHSPNHWDGEETGNKHVFFILDDCKTPDSTRGFYNEFLSDDLREHRKTMEMLSSKMLVSPSDEQLSGVGFSTTSKRSVVVKVTGSVTRKIKVQF